MKAGDRVESIHDFCRTGTVEEHHRRYNCLWGVRSDSTGHLYWLFTAEITPIKGDA